MRPTDEERREVAENLRNMCGCGCRYAEEFYELLNDTVMRAWDFHDFHDVANRLADLIEPEERTCRMIDNGVELCCSVCDRRHGYDDEPDFCMGCGAKVVQR